MLSSECAWRVLHAEHASMRELSDSVDAALRGDGWRRPGPGLEAVRAPLQRLQTFDDATHRPKGVVLMATLRGRSAQADALLDEHRATLLHHLEQEDTLLHSHTARLLTAAEWSKVVSSISSVVESAAARERRRRPDRAA